ncbi:MAG TPA: PTS sugar transporter subunit IIA [Nocardioidaceae bacterium]
MTQITQLISPDAIVVDERVSDWEEAVRAAGRLLEATGVTDPAYTQAMVDSVHENGPYIVVAPGFAFAHARPSEAVHRTGMSWVRLAEPVEFGHKSNDPVTLVVAMAATDSSTHQQAMASLARLIGDKSKKSTLDEASSPEEVYALLDGGTPAASAAPAAASRATPPGSGGATGAEPSPDGARGSSSSNGSTRDRILTVCGNGLGTSLFLKNTLEQVLAHWGWGNLITVEATDTVSARGKAKEADLILTSGEIARTLGDVGVPLRVIENFTSTTEIDAVLRQMYDV